jgi:hypothetical protein
LKEIFESIEDLKKLDFIDSEVYTPSSKAVSQYYVKEPKVLYWM